MGEVVICGSPLSDMLALSRDFASMPGFIKRGFPRSTDNQPEDRKQ